VNSSIVVAKKPTRYGFLTLANYSLIALSNAIEPLRMANALSQSKTFEWAVLSLTGEPVAASNGLTLTPTQSVESYPKPDILFVCGGVEVRHAVTSSVLQLLKRLNEQKVPLGALCTGGYALAKAGLLDRFNATIHWLCAMNFRASIFRIRCIPLIGTVIPAQAVLRRSISCCI
jgi:AraC family transcriptional regulator, glycine betaine-responsive activator